ncbi:MAG: hypothetical protein ACI9KE_001255 [Polyangiales bacterium]
MKYLAHLSLCLFAFAACSDDVIIFDDAGPSDDVFADDVGEDVPLTECTEALPPLEEGGDGQAAPLDAAAGEARAGRLAEGDIPPDPDDLLVWRAGDWVLANENIAVVIEDVGTSDGYEVWGGKIIGLARVEDGAMVEPADFNEIIWGSGRFSNEVTSVGVMNDGSDGEAAVIRAVGPMRAIPFVEVFAVALFPGSYDDIDLAIDYTLEPGAEKVDVRYTYLNRTPRQNATQQVLLAFQKERMPAFAPDRGYDFAGQLDYIGFGKEGRTSFALDTPLQDLTFFIEVSGTFVLNGANIVLPPCGRTTVEAATYYVGGPGSNGVQAAIARENGDVLKTVTGRVVDANGAGAAGVRVHAHQGDGEGDDDVHFGRVMTDDTGAYSIQVRDEAMTLSTWRRGDEIVSVSLAAGATDADDLNLNPTGIIEIIAIEGGDPVPVRVQVAPTGAPILPNGNWGEEVIVQNRTHIVFPGVAPARVTVPVGSHRVIVSRGFEYEIGLDEVLDVTADAVTSRTVEMERVVETPNTLCADYHIHTNRSPDSPDDPSFKLRSAAGDGLEVPLRSDHEWVYEWESLIAEQGLESFLFGVTSLELTTFEWGHFGVFPLTPDAALPNRGAVPWAGDNPPEVFERIRAIDSAPSLIINHARSGAGLGYFAYAGYDNVTGEVNETEMWDEAFTLLEVFNEESFEEADVLVQDWFSFLRAGRRVFGVGSSDSHKVQRGAAIGYPRTCLEIGTDDPAALRAGGGADLVQTTTEAGHFFVSGGIYLDVTGRDGARPGDEVTGADAMETLSVRVQAPSWVDVDVLEVWVDGELTSTTPVTAGDGVDRGTYEVMVPVSAAGSFAIIHAKGDLPLDPVYFGHQPFAVSMPIFYSL